MSATFNKPNGLKYTDMCIYIDAHLADIAEPYVNPEIESTIYEYLYHLVYALSCKSGYFRNFADYDSFALYAACELYLSMRKKQQQAGKEVRGKLINPVKSSLNFVKATLFPLKINYQRENFTAITDPNITEDPVFADEEAKEAMQGQYRGYLDDSYATAIAQVPEYLMRAVAATPFKGADPSMYHKLYMSAILTFINDITLPARVREGIRTRIKDDPSGDKLANRMLTAYTSNEPDTVLWHLDDRYSAYVRLLVTKAKKTFSKELEYYLHADDLSDELLDCIMNNAYECFTSTGDFDQ